MTTRETALVIRIFLELDPLLRQLKEPKWWYPGIEPKTWGRWHDGTTKTAEPDSAAGVAAGLWDSLHKAKAEPVRAVAFERIAQFAPDAAKTEWIIEPSKPPEDMSKEKAQQQLDSQLARLRTLFVDWFTRLAEQDQNAGKSPVHTTGHLSLALEVLVAPFPKTTAKGYRPLGPDVVPVKAGRTLRVRITVSSPAYLYAWWVTPMSQVVPLYPWKPGDWNHFAVEPEKPATALELPWTQEGVLTHWTLTAEPGLETLVVLARREPMPNDTRAELRRTLTKLPVPKAGLEIGPGPHECQLGAVELGGSRGLDLKARAVEDPVGDRHRAVDSALGLRGDAGRCLSFLNEG